ncbi:MAG: hypothetical protein IJ824_04815 [Alphaproteobacteria bacterium]|nr:hypothetical protein [Alphaproteobacteria bacterium]
MRLLWVLAAMFLMGAAEAHAYLETYSEDETQVTAGEQNTNLYRLNAMGSIAMKKLKKIDDAIARNPKAQVTAESVSAIVEMIDANEDENKKAMVLMLKRIAQTLQQPNTLKAAPDNDLYRRFAGLCAQDTRDAAVAAALLQKIKGTRR